MSPGVPYKRKLIEVALPLEAINSGSKADKNRKTGTTRSIHKWFAPMPTAALRAVLFAALVDAPQSEEELAEVMRIASQLAASGAVSPPADVLAQACRRILKDCGGQEGLPVVIDPFCGGGSTAIEAQRLGLHAAISDLNPVAVITAKVATGTLTALSTPETLDHARSITGRLISGSRDALDALVTHYAALIYEAVRSEIGALYAEPGGGMPLVWRWARTVPSRDPRFADVKVPLVRDWWFSKREDQSAYATPVFDEEARTVGIGIQHDGEPQFQGSQSRCVLSGAPITFDYLRSCGRQRQMGLVCLGSLRQVGERREVVPADKDHEKLVLDIPYPDLGPPLPLPEAGLGLRVQGYGLKTWLEVFTPRQATMLATFAKQVDRIQDSVMEQLPREAAVAVIRILGLAVSRMASYSSTQSLWRIDGRSGVGQPEAAFGRAALPMTFDFAEPNPFGGSRGDWMVVVRNVLSGLSLVPDDGPVPQVWQLDARAIHAMVTKPGLLLTDPPYYGQIGYADLSDYFYPWLRLALRKLEPDLFSTLLTPKAGELIADPTRHGGSEEAHDYFEEGFVEVFGTLTKVADDRFPILVVYAHRQQESTAEGVVSTGWEAMLEALIQAQLSIVGTWPIHGTGTTRQRAQSSNALATYVLLVCRKRPTESSLATRSEFLSALRSELPGATRLLQGGSIAPVDLAQSVIGPGMAVFSRFSRVVEADGSAMSVRTALGLINEVLEEALTEEETEFDGDTRWALTWFEQHGMNPGPFGVAESLSKAKDTSVTGVVEAGIVVSRDGKVRLKGRDELSEDWDPTEDRRPTVWEATQHLIRRVGQSEVSAADLLRRLGPGYGDRARQLAYLLYQISERKGWAKEAVACNSLIVAWPELSRLASGGQGPVQQTLER